MPEGVIVGGWDFVIAGYTITAMVLIGYALSLRARFDKSGEGDPQ